MFLIYKDEFKRLNLTKDTRKVRNSLTLSVYTQEASPEFDHVDWCKISIRQITYIDILSSQNYLVFFALYLFLIFLPIDIHTYMYTDTHTTQTHCARTHTHMHKHTHVTPNHGSGFRQRRLNHDLDVQQRVCAMVHASFWTTLRFQWKNENQQHRRLDDHVSYLNFLVNK